MPQRLDQDLARPELILLQHQPLEQVGARGAVAAGGVRDPPSGQDRDDPREHVDADVADQAVALEVAQQAGAVHVVGAAVQDRRHHDGQLLGKMLTVGVHRDDDLRAELQRDLVADPKGQPAAPVDRQLRDQRARGPGFRGGGIGAAVAHHDRDDLQTLEPCGQRRDHRPDVARLVERRQDHHEPTARRGASAARSQSNRSRPSASTSSRIIRSFVSPSDCTRTTRKNRTMIARITTNSTRRSLPGATSNQPNSGPYTEGRIASTTVPRASARDDQEAEPADPAPIVGACGEEQTRDRRDDAQEPDGRHRTLTSVGRHRSRGRMWSAMTRSLNRAITENIDSTSSADSRCGRSPRSSSFVCAGL